MSLSVTLVVNVASVHDQKLSRKVSLMILYCLTISTRAQPIAIDDLNDSSMRVRLGETEYAVYASSARTIQEIADPASVESTSDNQPGMLETRQDDDTMIHAETMSIESSIFPAPSIATGIEQTLQLTTSKTITTAIMESSTPAGSCPSDGHRSAAVHAANVCVMSLNVIVICAFIVSMCLTYKRQRSRIRIYTRTADEDDYLHTQQHVDKRQRPLTPHPLKLKLKGERWHTPASSSPHSTSYYPKNHDALSPNPPTPYSHSLIPDTVADLPSFHPLQKKRSWLDTAKRSVIPLSSYIREESR